jgi:hypothetical protein
MSQHHAVVLEIVGGSVENVYQSGRIEVIYLDVDELRGSQERLARKWSEVDDLPAEVRGQARQVLIDLDIELVECKFCHQPTPAHTAHRHEYGWVGDDCCWDERLRSSQ